MEATFKSLANQVEKRQSVHSSAGNEVPLAEYRLANWQKRTKERWADVYVLWVDGASPCRR